MAKEIIVDLWKTDLHKKEIGIKKQEEYQAKSRQFTKDSDIIGKISGDSEGYVTIREDPWEAELTERRLILKLFTDSMNWKGSLEEMIGNSVAKSIASEHGVPILSINVGNHDNLIKVERVFKPMSLDKQMYSLLFIKDNTVIPYHIEENRLTMGSDWTVFNRYNDEIAEIDGSAFNIGGKYKITMKNDEYDIHKSLDEVLMLFAAYAKYETEVRDKLEETAKKMRNKDEQFELKLAQEEIDLYDNPRRLKY